MRILVTGGAGFIGSHLCRKYITEGCSVICLDDFSNGESINIQNLSTFSKFKLITGNVRDRDLIKKIVSEGLDAIVHLAAQIHVDKSIVNPYLTFETNYIGTLNLLEAARKYDVKKIIHTSTSEVYGSAQFSLINEEHPLDAIHPYGASKIAAEKLCYSYIQTYGMNVAVMRPFNTFGPRQKDKDYGGVISLFIKRVLNGLPPQIYGDGNQTRDFLYVEDLIQAYDLILKYDQLLKTPLNFGTEKETNIIELADLIIRLLGREGQIKPLYVAPRRIEVRRLVADCSKAKQILGWKPRNSLEEGLRQLINWYRKL